MAKINNKKFNKKTRDQLITYAMVIIVFAIVSFVKAGGGLSSLANGLLVPLCIYSIAAVGLNLCVGYLGELSLGHAGFMCIGAFSSAFFTHYFMGSSMPPMLRFILAFIVGVVIAGVFGFLIGIPVLRLRGDYLAIVTLAFGEIVKNVINVLYVGRDSNGIHIGITSERALGLEKDGKMLINGAKGIMGTQRQSTFLIGIIVLLICLFVTYNLVNSRSGRAIMAIRDNRIAAESVGINITKYKLLGFAISAAMSGAAGVLYGHNLATLQALPANFGYNMSIMILVFVVLGGIGSIRGSVIAAVILTILPEALRGLNDYRMLMYAILLIAMMLFNWSPKSREWIEVHFTKKNKEVV
ncbi:MAG: branched-chain amino acid ABC transporter permease [Lachnospiraceae bacterium]|nr:branched-chain amino acid ABC transporter permease [Lachnospiraceae bacterium]